jgi:hypothetical protein
MRNGIAIAALTAASAVLQTASAADLPERPVLKAPAPVAALNWSGFYLTAAAATASGPRIRPPP